MTAIRLLLVVLFLAGASCGNEKDGSRRLGRWAAGPDTGNLDLLAVHFIDSDNGWAVGNIEPAGSTSGAILKTSDGGLSWQPIARTQEVYADVQFVSQTVGWVAGYGGRIERTEDGGNTWKIQRVEREGEVLNSVSFLDQRQGWIAGGHGIVLRTTNGGDTWRASPTGRVEDLWSIRALSAERCWIVGEDGLILATSDGGVTWFENRSEVRGALYGLDYEHGKEGGILIVAVGQDGAVLRTENGTSWAAVNSGTDAPLYAVASGGGGVFWAVGADGVTVGSTDSGKTWNLVQPVTPRNLLAIDLKAPARGVAVGKRGATQLLRD